MMKERRHNRGGGPLNKQQGMVTILVSMVILLLITFISLYTSKSIIIEQKVTANELRYRQAFEAAQAGLAIAIDYINIGLDRDGDGVVDQLIDTDGDPDQIGDTNTTRVGRNRIVVQAQDLSGGNLTVIEITSQGFSDDESSNRLLRKVISVVDPIPNDPDAPITARGAFVINGSATVHNPEGHSTIWSGGDVDLGSNNSTATEIADVADLSYPGCMDTPMTCGLARSSNKVSIGLDVIEHDGNLSNLSPNIFFKNFFGITPQAFLTTSVTQVVTPSNAASALDLATEEIVWIDGDAIINGVTFGCNVPVNGNNICPVNNELPSILIVDGNLEFRGGQYYGVIYVAGQVLVRGNTTIHGALIAAGDLTSQAGGSLDIWYNSRILTKISRIGPFSSTSGTWRDF